MTQKRLLSTGAALLAALCLLLALSGCGGEKPLLEQPIKTLTCVEPTALPTLVPLGDGRVLAGWVDYENEMTHLSVVDVAADKELAAQTLEGCWELQTEQFTAGSAVLCTTLSKSASGFCIRIILINFVLGSRADQTGPSLGMMLFCSNLTYSVIILVCS